MEVVPFDGTEIPAADPELIIFVSAQAENWGTDLILTVVHTKNYVRAQFFSTRTLKNWNASLTQGVPTRFGEMKMSRHSISRWKCSE